MEDTLRVGNGQTKVMNIKSLNPCFNGRYSQSSINELSNGACNRVVLILVLMEDTLRDPIHPIVR